MNIFVIVGVLSLLGMLAHDIKLLIPALGVSGIIGLVFGVGAFMIDPGPKATDAWNVALLCLEMIVGLQVSFFLALLIRGHAPWLRT